MLIHCMCPCRIVLVRGGVPSAARLTGPSRFHKLTQTDRKTRLELLVKRANISPKGVPLHCSVVGISFNQTVLGGILWPIIET